MLIAVPVAHPWLVEAMRVIFNDCRLHMTKQIPEVTAEAQQRWWNGLDKSRTKAFLYADVQRPWKFVGFAFLQKKGDVWTPTAGITSSERGKGYYRAILRHYIREAGGPLEGEELESHEQIIKLNAEAGWQEDGRVEGIIYLSHTGKLTDRDQEILNLIMDYHDDLSRNPR